MHLVDGIILPLFANVFFTIISFKITKNCTDLFLFSLKTSRKIQFPGYVSIILFHVLSFAYASSGTDKAYLHISV